VTLLLLAGTAEARELASELAEQRLPAIASLAGAVARPAELPIPTHIGGFGGAAGFRDFVKAHGITAVLDATHPFAHHITTRTAAITAELGLPYARLIRPEWQVGEGDKWQIVENPEQAMRAVPKGARLFLATGAKEIATYAPLGTKAQVYCRRVDPAQGFPWPGGEWIIGRGPFELAGELDLFRRLKITHILCKNAGGAATQAKLTAARHLGLPVIMISRPQEPAGIKRLTNVSEALTWVRRALGLGETGTSKCS
jgi:precorrin-6A/cobalt-precorrin-6A reductase